MNWRTFFGSWTRASVTMFVVAVAFAIVAPTAFERLAGNLATILGVATERVITAVSTVVCTAIVRGLNSRAGQDLLAIGILLLLFRAFLNRGKA